MISLEKELRAILTALAAQDYETAELVFGPPASEEDVCAMEAELGIPLPTSLREVLTTVSGHVEFRWSAPRGHEFPKPFHEIFSGTLFWSLDSLADFEAGRRGWIEACFPDPANSYDAIWHNKLAFQWVPNGDLIAIDLRPAHAGEIVYLSHDDGEGHGKVMAPSFQALIERWVELACPGGEDWQWLPFMGDDGLDPKGDIARAWRQLLKLGGISLDQAL